MADWWDHQQRWRRRWQRWHDRFQDRLEAWRVRRREAAEVRAAQRRQRMDDVIEEGIQQAMTRSLLSQMSGDVLARLLVEVWAQHRDELQAQALAAVRDEHAQELEDLKERLRDRAAKERAEIERDADAVIEQGIRDGLAEREQELVERLAERKQQRDQARQERDEATHLVLHLVRQLIGPKPVYLHSRGITELDQFRLNALLAKHGVRLRSKLTTSERQVRTQLDLIRTEARTLFWLEPCPVGATPRPDDDEDEETPAASLPAGPPVAEEAR